MFHSFALLLARVLPRRIHSSEYREIDNRKKMRRLGPIPEENGRAAVAFLFQLGACLRKGCPISVQK